MSPPSPDAPVLPDRMTVGIVAERRESRHAWAPATWRSVAIIAGGGPGEAPRLMEGGEERALWYVGQTEVELFTRETDGYLHNLSSEQPQVFVVLRGVDEADTVLPFLATACPYEAQAYLDSGEESVEGVAMPPVVVSWIEAFVERHHVDEPFVKRKQKSKTPRDKSNPFGRTPTTANSRDGGQGGS